MGPENLVIRFAHNKTKNFLIGLDFNRKVWYVCCCASACFNVAKNHSNGEGLKNSLPLSLKNL